MVEFHAPYNSLRRLGQTAVSVAPVVEPAAPVAVVPAAPAPVTTILPAVDYDKSFVSLSPAGLAVGGIALLVVGFSVAKAFQRR